MKFRHSNKAKRMCGGCKNHGSCKWCLGNREHQWRKEIESWGYDVSKWDMATREVTDVERD